MLKHWQTSLIGILMIVGGLAQAGVALLNGQHVDTTALWATLVGGIGFLRTPDLNKVQEK